MFKQLKKIVLLCLLAIFTLVASPSVRNLWQINHFDQYSVRSPKKIKILAKKNVLQWRKTGTKYYNNEGDSSTGPIWDFTSRDTVIYEASGNLVVEKKSRKQSGWHEDSLESIDSSIYRDGKLIKKVELRYYNYDPYVFRYTLMLKDDEKSVEFSCSTWNRLLGKWKPDHKIVDVYSVPKDDVRFTDFNGFIRSEGYGYDTAAGSWTVGYSMTKIESECDDTTLVRELKADTAIHIGPVRSIMIFKTSDWSKENLLYEVYQEKDSLSGSYVNVQKIVTTDNGDESFDWNPLTLSYVSISRRSILKDAYGNDTLHLSYIYIDSLSIWDTTGLTRYIRKYDDYGNNIEVINSYRYGSSKEWTIKSKQITTFEPYVSPVKKSIQQSIAPQITIAKSKKSLKISAPGLTGLNCYTLSGRLILSVRQNAASSILIHYSKVSAGAGIYYVKVEYSGGTRTFSMMIR